MAKPPLKEQSQEDLITYIMALRQEVQEVREEAKPYVEAFQGLGSAEQKALIHVVRLLATDPKSGAERMQELSTAILGDKPETTTTTTPEEEPTMTTESTDGAPPAWAAALVEKIAGLEQMIVTSQQTAEQRELDALRAQVASYGFEEGTPEWEEFCTIAGSITQGDLDKAFDYFAAVHPDLVDVEGAEETAPAAPAPALPGFPKTATAPGAVLGTITPPADEKIDYSSKGTAAAARSLLESLTSNPLNP